MRSMRHRRVALATVIMAAATAIPSATSAQTPYRAACDLLSDEAVTAVLGVAVMSARDGTRSECSYSSADFRTRFSTVLGTDAYAEEFTRAQEGARETTVAGLRGVVDPGGGRLVVALEDGGVLDVLLSVPDADEARLVELATSLAQAILESGAVAAVPPDRGAVDMLRVVTSMCDALSSDEVNAVTGGSYAPSGEAVAGNERCMYTAPDSGDSVIFGLAEDVDDRVDVGMYGSEELTVAGRPANWDPVDWLAVDAGAERKFDVIFLDSDGPDTPRRDQAIAIAEAAIPRLTTAAS